LQSQGVEVFFTIDAGPQVKAVCTADDQPRVLEALTATTGVQDIMLSGLGHGASLLVDE